MKTTYHQHRLQGTLFFDTKKNQSFKIVAIKSDHTTNHVRAIYLRAKDGSTQQFTDIFLEKLLLSGEIEIRS